MPPERAGFMDEWIAENINIRSFFNMVRLEEAKLARESCSKTFGVSGPKM